MKKTGKILLIWIITLGVIGFGIYLFLQVRKSRADQELVHANSTQVIRVNIDNIVYELLKARIRGTDTVQDTVKRVAIWKTGIAVPSALYFFTLSDADSVWHAILRVKDSRQFANYLRSHLDAEVADQGNGWTAHARNGHIRVSCNGDLAVFSVSPKPITDAAGQQSILQQQAQLTKVADMPWSERIKTRADLFYLHVQKPVNFGISFSPGKAHIEGNYTSDLWRLPEQGVSTKRTDEQLLVFRLYADIRPWLLTKRDFFARQQVDIDRVQPYIGNYWEGRIDTSHLEQQQTIITYDYDDNFEMTEKTETRTEDVAGMTVVLKASPHLLPYLPDRLYYQVIKKWNDGLAQLSTDPDQALPAASDIRNQHQDVVAYLSYQRGSNDVKLPFWPPYMRIVERIELTGRRTSPTSMDIQGEIGFTRKTKHPLTVLLEMSTTKPAD